MNRTKAFFYGGVMTSLVIMMFAGTLYGASVTVQREGSLQNGQMGATPDHMKADSNQLRFAPQGLKNKSDTGVESDAGNPSVRMERYKPYQEGEGERKVR